jgi:hypothetical protein
VPRLRRPGEVGWCRRELNRIPDAIHGYDAFLLR